jgi:hypothetical protein
VDHDDFTAAVPVRVGIFFGWAAVCGPTCMANAVDAIQRSNANGLFEVSQFAGRAADIQMAVLSDHGNSGGVVAAVLKPLQAVENQRHNAFRPDITDNSAHSE